MASGSWDKTVVIWVQEVEGHPWRQVTKLHLPDKVEGLSWSETGGVLAVSFGDGESAMYKDAGDGSYTQVAKVHENGLEDVPNSLLSGLAAAQDNEPKVMLETITPGDGKTFPKTGDILTMHYIGKLASTGSKFDSSYDRGTPFEFQIGLGKVIDGWDQGVIQMSLGQKALLKVPYALGYGEEGAGEGVIPPKTDLLFEVQLLNIRN
jgi:FK506-binding protein 1